MVVCAKDIRNDAGVSGLNLVVGLGRTGASCARFLADRNVQVIVVDSRDNPPELDSLRRTHPHVPVHTGGFDAEVFSRARRVLLSPGVSLSEPAVNAVVERGVSVIGDIELFAQTATAPVIAVTGSNGKSTVATMVYEMAQASGRDTRLGGNVGTPALDLITDAEPELYVLELSSFQLETTESLNAMVAVVLNVTPDHMDRYPSVEAYTNAKRQVFAGTGAMILNADDSVVAGMADTRRENIFFTLGAPRSDRDYGIRDLEGVAWLCRGRVPLMRADALGVSGRHNVANALAAVALGSVAGLPDNAMVKALGSFPGLAHRMETVAEHLGIRWINDSKATNVGATLAAVRGCAEPIVLIAGGDGKGADFTMLADTLAETVADAGPGRVRQVVLLGRDAERLEQAINGRVPTVRVSSMDDAVTIAGAQAQKGDVVLLSPACSSLDMFDDFTHRGDVFKTAVRRWIA